MASNEIKIILSADAGQLATEARQAIDSIDKIGTSVKRTANDATRGFNDLKSSISGVPKSFDEVAASADAMKRISARIDEMAAAALSGGQDLRNFATKVPLQDLRKLDGALRDIKRSIEWKDQIGLARVGFEKIKTSADGLVNSTTKLRSTSSSAALALNDIGRIAQDVPFGFIGIQNNLNPLLESFRRLRAESGSTGGALKALASQIGGVGGIGLALSLVSSAFVIYQNGIAGFNRKTKEAKEEFKDFLESLKDSRQVAEAAAGSVEAQIVEVRALSAAALDLNNSTEQRKRALQDLARINKEYFGNLTLEESSLAKLTAATNEYTKALIAQAVAKGFADEISKASTELNKQEGILTRLEGEYRALGTVTADNLKKASQFGAAYQDVQKIVDKGSAEDAFINQRNLVEKLRSDLVGLKSSYVEALAEGRKFASLDGSGTNTKKEVDAIKQRVSALKELIQAGVDVKKNTLELQGLEIKLIRRDGKKNGLSEDEINKLIFAQFPDFKGGIKLSKPTVVTVPLQINPVAEVIKANDPVGDDLQNAINRMYTSIVKNAQKDRDDAAKKLAAQGQSLASVITDGALATMVSFSESIGLVLANGDFMAGAQNFLNTIGSVLQQIGIQIVTTSKLVIALKTALDNLWAAGPAGAIASLGVGLAMIAAGTALKNMKFRTPKLAQGGLVTGPTVATVGDAGPELIVPYNRVNSFMDGGMGGRVEFEIAGAKLVGVLNRANNSLSRRGG